MDEYTQALAIANHVLDRPNADPDDDLSVLARHLLRANERIEAFKAEWPLRDMAVRFRIPRG